MSNVKTVAQSMVETYHIIKPIDLNSANRLYGGTLMGWIDEVAVLVARKHAQMSVVTGSVTNLKFLHGAYLRDTIVLSGKATYVGNTSMEVKVETSVEHINGKRELINIAYFTMVGLDDNDKPTKLPGLLLETEEDREEWEHARQRRELARKMD